MIRFPMTKTFKTNRWRSLSAASGYAYAAVFCLICTLSMALPASGLQAQDSVKPFLGRWDLTVKTPTEEYPAWIQVSDEDGQVKVEMVDRAGNAQPLPRAEVKNGEITFFSPGADFYRKNDMVFQGRLVANRLTGTTKGPDGTPWQWTGTRAPSLKRTAAPKWGRPITLFNGKNLSGWKFSDPGNAHNWKVEDGMLVNTGHGSEIITDRKFEDFKLHLEFKCGPQSNSGVYLRGRYEVQIETDSVAEPPSHHTGGVYGFIAPTPELPRKDGVWQTFDITFVGRTVTVVQNGQTIIDHKGIPGITGGALDSHEALPGPIYLQGSEAGTVAFRNIVITPATN